MSTTLRERHAKRFANIWNQSQQLVQIVLSNYIQARPNKTIEMIIHEWLETLLSAPIQLTFNSNSISLFNHKHHPEWVVDLAACPSELLEIILSMVSYPTTTNESDHRHRDTFKKRVNVRTFALTYLNYEHNAFLDNALDRCQMVKSLLSIQDCQNHPMYQKKIKSILKNWLMSHQNLVPISSIKHEKMISYLRSILDQ